MLHLIGAGVLAISTPIVMTGGAEASPNPAQCTTTTSTDASGVHSRVCLQVLQIKHLPLRRLAAVVRRQAAILGEHHPAHVGVVMSTRRAATTLTGSIENEDTPIYFVQAQGYFTCGVGCFVPPGAKSPTGHYLTLGLSLAHLDVVDFGIADQAVNLQHLGPTHRLLSR